MKVAINTQSTSGQKSGFGFYVSNLLRTVPSLGVEYLPIAKDQGNKDMDTPARFIWDQIEFPGKSNATQADIVHQPCFSSPVFSRKPVVVTIHDIIPVLFPENLALPSRLFFKVWTPFSYRFAKRYITISECSKQDIVRHLGIPSEKIVVIPLAAGSEYRPRATPAEQVETAAVLKKYEVQSPYFLHVATIEPRKNLQFLVRAFAQAVKQGLTAHKLVITGKKGWRTKELDAVIEDTGMQEKVIFTGYVEDIELPHLYNGATASVFASLYEGFGLPPLEAMASGTPLICSNASSLPEVVGEAGILLSPTNQAAWTQAILELAGDPVRCRQLSQAGLKQASKFSWEETARQTAEVYRSLIP